MDSTSIVLPGSEIESLQLQKNQLRIRFSRAYLLKTMTGSVEQTRWWQTGELILEGVQLSEPLPPMPAICAGGDIDDNVFTYRDMIPVPLETRGQVGCTLRFQDTDARLEARGTGLRLQMFDVPKYIEHIRPAGD